MIKRVFSLFLVICIFVSCFTFSSSAEEFENTGGWLNLYDYNPSMNRNFATSAGATKEYVFDLPARMRLYDIDIVMFATNGAPDVSVLKGNGQTVLLNKATFGNNMVRYYGSIYYTNYDNVTLLIGDSVSHSGSIISATVCSAVSTSYSEIGSFRFQGGNYNNPIDQTVTMVSSTAAANFVIGGLDFDPYKINFTAPNWIRYDYMDFIISLDGVSVDSISAYHKGRAINVDYELVNGTYSSYYYLVIRLDLTGLDREVSDLPTISITGQQSDSVGISLVSVKGVLNYDVPNPYLHWLSEIHVLLSNNLLSIQKSIATLNSNIVSKLDILKTTISTMNTNIGAKLDTLKTNVTTMNSNLGSKLDSISSSISTGFINLGNLFSAEATSTRNSISKHFTNLQNWLSSGFKSVTDKLDILINGSVEQQESAEDYKDDSADKSEQIDNAINNMNVSKPPSNDINSSVEDISGGLDFGIFNSTLLVLTGQGYVSHILFIAVTLMLAAYVFFGKRG